MSAVRSDARLRERLFAGVQWLLPTRLLSLCVYALTRVQAPWFKNPLIRVFMRHFGISLSEAELQRPESFPSFNAFFTRALCDGARPLPPDPTAIVSPVDGTVSEVGRIHGGRLVQAKGHEYGLAELLAGDSKLAARFADGNFCTIYLAPYNYHRIHMPLPGTLREWIFVPGRLFSVNQATARAVPRLFARNERVISIFDTAHGPLALIMVGALFVGSIETVWAGRITPPHTRSGIAMHQLQQPIDYPRGAEIGRFNMGSTVILLAPPGALDWLADLKPGRALRMGQAIGAPAR